MARDTVADRIAARMFRITDAAVRETDSRLRKLAITVPQMRVLLALPPGTSLPQKDLARELGCDVSNITGVVDRLEQKKLVTRSGHENDRRVKLVEATAEGLRLQRRLRTVRAAVARRFYSSLNRREQRALLELVGRLSE